MGDRPEWMPSSEEVTNAHPIPEALNGADVSTYCGCADCLHYQTGLRAQIAVLEEMNAAMTKQNGGPFCNEESEWSNAKIAALRKELEG